MEDRLVTPDKVIEEAKKQALKRQQQHPWPELVFLADGEGTPALKGYLSAVKKGRISLTYWANETYEEPIELGSQSWEHAESGHSQTGINELAAIVGPKHGFETVKPLKLFGKIIQLWCHPDGIVLDPFAGSGTTGHATLVLNRATNSSRRFILIEQSRPERGDPYARTLLADRLKRTITGDWHAGRQEPLGGGFTFKTSTTQVDGRAVLAMQREELVDLVLMSHWEVRSRKGPMLTTLVHKAYKYLVAKDVAGHGYFLIWEGPNVKAPLTESVLREIGKEAECEGLAPPYHVYARIAHVLDEDVVFWKIPRDILMKIGFNEMVNSGEGQ
jgi:adenine-specific DNA-methyltransferase